MDHINHTFKQCHVAHSNPKCIKYFVRIISTPKPSFSLLVSVWISWLLMSTITRDPFERKKMLLLNQAVTDMVNMTYYLLFKLLYMIYQVITHKTMINYAKMTFSILDLTTSSRIALFTVILYYKIQSVCVSICMSVRNRLQNHACCSNEFFTGHSMALG